MANYSVADRAELHGALSDLRDKILNHTSLKDVKFAKFREDAIVRMHLAPLRPNDPSFPLDEPLQRILRKLSHPTAQYSILDVICSDEASYPSRPKVVADLIADIDEARENIQAGAY